MMIPSVGDVFISHIWANWMCYRSFSDAKMNTECGYIYLRCPIMITSRCNNVITLLDVHGRTGFDNYENFIKIFEKTRTLYDGPSFTLLR